jgi:hypothetical protein
VERLRFPCCVLLASLLAGCVSVATQPLTLELPEPPSEELRREVERVAVVAGRFEPPVQVTGPAMGTLSGAGRGASVGAVTGAATGLFIGTLGGIIPLFLVTTPVGSAIGVVVGGTSGALMARSGRVVGAEHRQIAAELAQRDLQACLRDRVAALADAATEKDVEVRRDLGPDASGALPDYGTSEGHVLEIRIEKLEVFGWGIRSPQTRVFAVARTRLIAPAGSEEVYGQRIFSSSESRSWRNWIAAPGSVAGSVDDACEFLAQRIVEEVFVLVIPPGWEPPGPPACNSAGWCTVRGLLPQPVGSSDAHRWFETDTRQPALQWLPLEGQAARYDLRVWRAEDGVPAELVYERERLPEPQHQLETRLEPDTEYLWSIRAHFEVDGQPRRTPWSEIALPSPGQQGSPMLVPAGFTRVRGASRVPGSHSPTYYRFKTPADGEPD